MENKIEFTEIEKIETIGSFLMNYYNILDGYCKVNTYIKKDDFVSFQSYILNFMTNWKVIRSVPKSIDSNDIRTNLCKEIFNFITVSQFDKCNVKVLSDKLNEITNRNLISLSSKVLFIHAPQFYFPYDSLVKKALDIQNDDYAQFYNEVLNFKTDHLKASICPIIKSIEGFTEKIENKFNEIDPNVLNEIRLNRIVDKLLWTRGKNKAAAVNENGQILT